MNARRIALILGVVLAFLFLTIPATSEPEQGIIVDGADVILDMPVIPDQSLFDAIEVAGPRVVVEYANHIRRMALVVVPGPLQTLLDQVSERVVVQYANATLRAELPALHPDLQEMLNQVSMRVVFEFANANLAYALAYPQQLVNDTTPPVVSDIAVGQMTAGGIVTITWTTDEFANSTVLYDTVSEPDPYTYTASDPLYVEPHAVGLPDMVPGTTYYYRLRSTDLGDNTTTTPEYSFTVQEKAIIYLPVVIRSEP